MRRQAIKRIAGPWVAPLLAFALRLVHRDRGLAVLYHEIVPDTAAGAPRVVPAVGRAVFRRQLRHLRRHYEIVPAERLPQAVAARRRGQRFPVCLTFDDDAREHVIDAVPILREEGVTATFFLSGAFLSGDGQPFWWQDLQRLLDTGTPLRDLAALLPAGGDGVSDVQALAAAIERLEAPDRALLAGRLRTLAAAAGSEAWLSASDVGTIVEAGCSVGFHTLRHERLDSLDDAALAAALSDGRDALSGASGEAVAAIAYPHGRADGRVARMARDAGFRLGFTNVGRATTTASDPLLLGRLPAPNSPGELAVALVGSLARGSRDGRA